MEDIKKLASELVDKIKSDPELLKKFKSDPAAAIKSVSGIDLPEDSIKTVTAAVQAKLAAGDVADIAGKLGKLF